MRIRWHGLEFVGDEGPATYTIETDGLTGVLDGTGVRRDGDSRPNQDGEFEADGFLSGISGSISGLVRADSPYDYERAVRRLKSIPVRGVAPLSVQSASGAVYCMAQRVGRVDVRPLVYGSAARYMVEWFAPDPFWFGETATFTGSAVSLFHRGDYEASPVVEVVGPQSAYTVTGPDGEVFQVNQALSSGQTHRIDMSTGWVYRNGALQVGVVGRGETWSVPPGRVVSVSTSASSMRVLVTDTFV